MRILVTGASGCVGRALALRLIGAGHDVVCTVRDRSSTSDIVPRAERVEIDLTQPIDPTRLPATCDAVVHLAQSRDHRNFPGKAGEIFAINVAATQALADYALAAGAKTFVYASTGTVYVPQAHPLLETAVTSPSTFYAASKLASEALLTPYRTCMHVFVPRLFYVYGPGQLGMLTTALADRIRAGRPVSLHGENGLRLSPTYSGDVAAVFETAIMQRWDGCMNVASPEVVTLREYAQSIGRSLEREVRFENSEDPEPTDLLPNLTLLTERYDPTSFVSPQTGLNLTFTGT